MKIRSSRSAVGQQYGSSGSSILKRVLVRCSLDSTDRRGIRWLAGVRVPTGPLYFLCRAAKKYYDRNDKDDKPVMDSKNPKPKSSAKPAAESGKPKKAPKKPKAKGS